jgi:hypothetical protein
MNVIFNGVSRHQHKIGVSGSERNKLTPAWRYTSSGVVWRVVPTASGKVVGEVRDIPEKLVSFFCVNLRTGEVLWEEARFGERWWIGIEAVHHDTLLLHKYATPDLPDHRALIAVDIRTGMELWRNEEVRFDHLGSESVAVTRAGAFGSEELRLDYRTGEVCDRSGAEGDVLLPAGPAMEFPTPLSTLEGDEVSHILLRRHCNSERVVYPLDCLDLDSLLVCNYHERLGGATDERPCMRSILVVVAKSSGDVLFTDVMIKEAWAVVPDAFFVCEGMLMYVHERTTLTAIELQQQ